MNYLAIDTSGKNLTIVLSADGKLYKYDDKECGVNHSVALMPKVEQIISDANFDLTNVDFICAVTGAGSFTGIRIGVSTVKALCFALNKPCIAITSFDTLAYNKLDGKTLAVIDAKHDAFYVCGYNNGTIEIQPSYITKADLLQLAKEWTIVSNGTIDGVESLSVSLLEGLIKAIEQNKDKVTFDLQSLVPLYVRKSQAEEGR